MRRLRLVALLLCAAAAPLPNDTSQTASFGPSFTAPKSWTLNQAPNEITLVAPEGDFRIAVVNAGQAASAADAAAAAWKIFNPAEHHTLKVTAPFPAKEGWDEAAALEYETSPEEHLDIRAFAFRKDKSWTVFLGGGSQSTSEKRIAALLLVVESLRPAGGSVENFAGRIAHDLDQSRLAALLQFTQDGMRKLRIPGVGIAVIQHGKLLYDGGLGVRSLGKPDKVDAHTLFMIASNTKGMTTLMLAKLADAGKLDWNQHVTEVYPAFRLGNDNVTKQVLIRHLICACTGIPRRDFEWLFNTTAATPPADTFSQLANTVPTSKFGEVFQYSNLMASAAGYIGGHIAHPDKDLGAAYDQAMQDLVFNPLGMADTTFDYTKVFANPDHATPHADTVDGTLTPARMAVNYEIIPFRPAGAAWSSPDDMIKYAQDELTQGKRPDGSVYVSSKNLLQRRVPNVTIGEDEAYGMGLEIVTKYGITVVHHGGDMIGFHSDWLAFTNADVGAVLLTNGDNGWALRHPFYRRILELLYDGRPEAQKELDASAAQIDAEIAKERPRLTVPAEPAQAAKLAPAYTNASLGHITVTHEGKHLIFDFGAWKSEMASRKNDDGTVSFVTIDPGNNGFPFVVTTQAGKRALIIRDGQHAYTYTE
jgi:CubicO group peptidase (beta-lactamase class C family)